MGKTVFARNRIFRGSYSKIRSGDLFELGDHRLLCGNSESHRDIRKLTGSRDVSFIFAGPPYFNQRAYSRWIDYDSYLKSMARVIANCTSVAQRGSTFSLQIGRGSAEHKDHVAHLSVLLDTLGLQFQEAIAWIKPGANYSIKRSCHIRSTGFYYPAFKWETLLIYRIPGPRSRMSLKDRTFMSKHGTDVWNIPWVTHQMTWFGHPAVCPVEIPERCIRAYAPRGTFLFDPFGGSGTTLIAAEGTGRRCLLMEQRPEYCLIVIRRWEELTGKKAHRM